jgi:predicted O-methyltransferase YrrM
MDSRRVSLVSQRWRYFRHGNFHGVSANWLRKQCDGIYSSVGEYIQGGSASTHVSLDTLKEGEEIFRSILKEKSGANYLNSFDCEVGLASFLYAYILAENPVTVVETGVANGITTNSIMRALEKTGGTLHSFDIDPRTQNVYKGNGNWHFHHLTGSLERSLQDQIGEIGNVDLWIHDSNHGFQWQTFEYGLAAKVLSSGGLLVSDDIDSSTAWGISSRNLFEHSSAIFDNRKFIGVAKVNR